MAVLLAGGAALGGCVAGAGSARSASGTPGGSPPAVSAGATSAAASAVAGPATAPGSAVPGAGPVTPGAEAAHVRTIGPADQGQQVVLRVGDRLSAVPTPRAGGWVVTEFPVGVLRPQDSTGAAPRHAFLAVSVGEGRLTLTPARPEARATGGYTVLIRVLRNTVQPPQP